MSIHQCGIQRKPLLLSRVSMVRDRGYNTPML
nr:MAG TPA: RNA polymerase Rpb5-like protein [Caudoviricetes sp.]